jgi:hypothetical protein
MSQTHQLSHDATSLSLDGLLPDLAAGGENYHSDGAAGQNGLGSAYDSFRYAIQLRSRP